MDPPSARQRLTGGASHHNRKGPTVPAWLDAVVAIATLVLAVAIAVHVGVL